jgi:hypothetical protein
MHVSKYLMWWKRKYFGFAWVHSTQHNTSFYRLRATANTNRFMAQSFLQRYCIFTAHGQNNPGSSTTRHVATTWVHDWIIQGTAAPRFWLVGSLPLWTISAWTHRHQTLHSPVLCNSKHWSNIIRRHARDLRVRAALRKWAMMIISCGAALALRRARRWMADRLANPRGRR